MGVAGVSGETPKRALRGSLAARFEAQFTPEPMSGCWLWTGTVMRKGYGTINAGGRGRVLKAHRASWILARGTIPDGLHVLHRCDNRACVNPNHLFLGTNIDNIADRDRKGRCRSAAPFGARNGAARLTAEMVSAIVARYRAGGVSQAMVAKEFGVAQGHVSNIVNGKARTRG